MEQSLVPISTTAAVAEELREQWERKGRQMAQKSTDLTKIAKMAQHPEFRAFVQKYFNSWSEVRVAVMMLRMYKDLEEVCAYLQPYQKISVLQQIISENKEVNHEHVNSIVKRHMTGEETLWSIGQRLYQTEETWQDLGNVMEHPELRAFVEKYFLQWDAADLVIVLLKLYHCLDEFTDLEPLEKLGLLHCLLQDRTCRQEFSRRVSAWKRGEAITFPSLPIMHQPRLLE